MLTQERRRARAHLANATARARKAPTDSAAQAAVENARRDYYATALEDYIRRVVDEAPELSPEQRDRLAQLLRGSDSDAAA